MLSGVLLLLFVRADTKFRASKNRGVRKADNMFMIVQAIRALAAFLADKVEPSEFYAYHVLADTLLTALHERFADVTSKNVADIFMLTTATRVVKKLVAGSPDPVAKMREIISSCGCSIELTQNGDLTDWSLTCPFAEAVHPNTPKKTMCPVALLFLGAVRLKEGESQITMQNLTTRGANFTIQHKR